ncbi:MAG: hypothetical protein ABSF81_00845 [Bacteroidales bacterium]
MKGEKLKFKPLKALWFYRDILKKEFSEIKDFVDETKNLIISRQKELEKHINNEIKKSRHSNSGQEIVEYYIDDIIKYDQTYIEILMNSTFISSYSLFENSFCRICKHAQKEKGKQINLNDLSGKGINQCKKYIEKVIEIDLSSLYTEWEEIQNYNKVRNLIVHNSANFEKDKSKALERQEMYLFITSNPFINVKREGRGYFYINDYQFIINFCDKAEKFLSEIIDKILNLEKK